MLLLETPGASPLDTIEMMAAACQMLPAFKTTSYRVKTSQFNQLSVCAPYTMLRGIFSVDVQHKTIEQGMSALRESPERLTHQRHMNMYEL